MFNVQGHNYPSSSYFTTTDTPPPPTTITTTAIIIIITTTTTTTTTIIATTIITSRPPPPVGITFYLNLNINFPRRRPIAVVVEMPGMLPGPSRRGLTWPSPRGATSQIA